MLIMMRSKRVLIMIEIMLRRRRRVFLGVRVFQQDAFLMSGDILMLRRIFDGDEFFVAFEAFVKGVLLAASSTSTTTSSTTASTSVDTTFGAALQLLRRRGC